MTWWREVAWGRHRRLVIAGAAVVVLVSLVVAYTLVVVGRIERLAVEPPGSAPGGTTYLLIGTDSRAGLDTPEAREAFGDPRGVRADILLVLRVFDDGREPRLVSLPRDLLVLAPPQAPTGLRRLALTWLEGPQQTVDALCRSLGLGVDHVVAVDIAGLEEIVDAVGGIELEMPGMLRDQVTGFSTVYPGVYSYAGGGAVQYVRSRHLEHFDWDTNTWVAEPDQRGDQARRVLRAVADEMSLSPLQPFGLHRLLWAGAGAVSVEEGAGITDLKGVADAVRDVGAADELTLPARLTAGPIPFAQLVDGAADVLGEVGAGGPSCTKAALPEARDS